MARGQAAKLRRRENRSKNKQEDEGDHNVNNSNDQDQSASEEASLPLPPKMAKKKKEAVVVETVTSDEEDEGESPMPKKKSSSKKRIPQHHAPPARNGLKTGPLILLILLTGTTLLPAFLYASDYFSKYMPSVVGNVGYRLGFGSVPKKRVLSFYEKHAPEKLAEVPKILANHYGDYPTLIKKLERKYQDYGYFIGWEDDEAPMRYALDSLQDTYSAWLRQWNRHAPQILKTAFRNIRYNLTTLYKKGYKIWRKNLWPHLEPFFGVPSGTAKQKRQDAADARKRQGSSSGSRTTRRKNREYRDEE